MHQFPADPVVREKWIKFVQRHRPDFCEPLSKYASLCSAHFDESSYSRNLSVLSTIDEGKQVRAILIRGAVPTRDTNVPAAPAVLSQRSKRQVSLTHVYTWFVCLICMNMHSHPIQKLHHFSCQVWSFSLLRRELLSWFEAWIYLECLCNYSRLKFLSLGPLSEVRKSNIQWYIMHVKPTKAK